MSQPVLVGTDFSSCANRAVQLAGRLAKGLACPLEVAHAWNPHALSAALFSGSIPLEPVMEAASAGARAALEQEVARCTGAGVDAHGRFVEGAASRALVALGSELPAQLIVLGRRGSADLSHVLLGSVSERVARGADRPVLVVPEGEGILEAPRRLVVGVDFSSAAREAVVAASRFSEAFRCAPPLLVHAYQDERAEWLASWSEVGRPLHARRDRTAFRSWVERAAPAAADAELLRVEGPVEDRLMEAARDRDADWIVVGLQGRTALATFLMGTTTRSVLELADRPVLIVPANAAPDREAVD